MADEIPHDGAPPKVPPTFPPIAKAEEPVVAEAGEEAEDIKADLKAEFEPELEPKPLPLRVRPFDPGRYHPRMYISPTGSIRRFSNFVRDVPEDLLLREPTSYLSTSATEGDVRAYRGYGALTVRDWYNELPARVLDIVDETSFGLFCSGLTRVIASRPFLGVLVER
ncbi:hypothetical protein ACSBR2_018945 [Camellia fascicularis]